MSVCQVEEYYVTINNLSTEGVETLAAFLATEKGQDTCPMGSETDEGEDYISIYGFECESTAITCEEMLLSVLG